MEKESGYSFSKGKWLVNVRRGVQGFAFLLFFFLLFHTVKVKSHEIPILSYLFVVLALFSLWYVYRLVRGLLSKSQKYQLPLVKGISFLLLTMVLGFLLSHYDQFSRPERGTFLNDQSKSIEQAIALYSKAKGRYDSFRSFTSLRTEISVKSESDVNVYFPPLLMLLNYLMFVSAVVLLVLAAAIHVRKSGTAYLKPVVTLSFILLLVSTLLFSLLDFDYKPGYSKDNTGSGYGYILNYFPTDLTHFNYYIAMPQNVFLKSSSLLGAITSLALRALVISLGFILFFIVLSVIFGRVFCGWVCPFGTFHQIISYFRMKIRGRYDHEIYLKKQRIKYMILTITLVSALFTINFA
ncbi:MAG: 4Fe-4S binding protein, partial [Spirochaetota bacterium]|nr:4Fe-4S binding protein [Spirochaetota bacterium]